MTSMAEIMRRPEVRARVANGVRASWGKPASRARRIAARQAFADRNRENSKWAIRQAWIAEKAASATGVNRKDMMREFGISFPSARDDMKRFKAANPGLLTYDTSAKVHRIQVLA